MMDCSSRQNFSFEVRGSEQVPRQKFRYAGHTLYEKNGEGYSPVNLPGDLYTDVPNEIEYHDTCEVTLNIDGAPFARSVDHCSDMVDTLRNRINTLTDRMENLNGEIQDLTGGVGSLTTSTVAAATGITAAKVASAELIAGSLSKGFSKYIGYMIQERLLEVKSKLPSTASTFKALSDSLNKRKDVLGQDYERISNRYTKFFVKLDDELKTRLLELDRPVFENCAQMQSTIFSNPFGDLLGQSVCAGTEQLQAADAVRISHLKETTAAAMELIKNYLAVIKRLSVSISNTLTDHKVAKTQTCSMPVIRMECDDIESQEKGKTETFIPQFFEDHFGMSIENNISAAFSDKENQHKSQSELEIVDGCFKQYCSKWASETKNGEIDPRVATKILMLWEQSKAEMFN